MNDNRGQEQMQYEKEYKEGANLDLGRYQGMSLKRTDWQIER